jgi:hypothetical protein
MAFLPLPRRIPPVLNGGVVHNGGRWAIAARKHRPPMPESTASNE